MTTRIKFCGITRSEDAQQAVELGVDALGFVFYGPSPRNIDVAVAAEIMTTLPAFVTSVALFVNATAEQVEQVIQLTNVDLLQFHGDESPEDCQQFGRPYIKAIRMRPDVDLAAEAERFSRSRGLLVDSYQQGVPGGTGETFNWDYVPGNLSLPIILAGGLHAGNVSSAIRSARPYAVDVSGGIESSKGIKDTHKMREFVSEVKRLE